MSILKQYVRIGSIGDTIVDENGIHYIQENRGPPIGVMVAVSTGDSKFRIGWSLISEKEDLTESVSEKRIVDTGKKGKKEVTVSKAIWTKERIWEYGTRLATERAMGQFDNPKIVPSILKDSLKRFERRCNAYFK